MFLKKLFSYTILIAGSLCVMMGFAFATMYVHGAIIARWGEADQSLLFWHLPILFIGIFSTAAGLALSFWGIGRLRSDNLPPSSPSEDYRNKLNQSCQTSVGKLTVGIQVQSKRLHAIPCGGQSYQYLYS